MRYSVLATALVLGACSLDSPSELAIQNVPTNPLVSLLTTQSATYAITQLGSQTSPPLLTWDAVCQGLRYQNEFSDTIFFNGDGTYRRVNNYRNHTWRTLGVPQPQPTLNYVFNELSGNIYGEGNVLRLSAPTSSGYSGFEIRGTALVRAERIGSGCLGGGNMVAAVYTRVAE
jgi:hypothetical protein